MTTDTVSINQKSSIELDQAYDEYVKQALNEARVSIKEGKFHSYEEVMSEFMKDD